MTCPALWILRGTMGDYDRDGETHAVEPRCNHDTPTGCCKHCGGGTR